MEIKTTSIATLSEGYGEILFPEVLRTDCLKSSINCVSIYPKNNRRRPDVLFLVCNGSYYITSDMTHKHNIIAMFEDKKSRNGVIYLNNLHIPLTSPPEVLEIYVVDGTGVRQDTSAVALFEIKGYSRNKLLTT